MCGRFTFTTPAELVAEAFGLDSAPLLVPRYNIAPTQPVAAVRVAPHGPRQLVILRWGLRPKAGERRGPLINARAETVMTRPAFRDAFARRRCLIPADGFYEWSGGPGHRQSFLLRRPDGGLFAMAALWEPPAPGDPEEAGSCVILTTDPNDVARRIHDRMPVILAPADYEQWLDASARPRDLADLLHPSPNEALSAVAVGTFVNDARHDGPECLRPAS